MGYIYCSEICFIFVFVFVFRIGIWNAKIGNEKSEGLDNYLLKLPRTIGQVYFLVQSESAAGLRIGLSVSVPEA